MRKLSAVVFPLFCFVVAAASAQMVQPDAVPVNSNATPAARALLHKIDEVSGKETLSGQHNFPNSVSRYSDRVYDLTGHFPAVFGQDFGFAGGEDKDSTRGRPSMIEEAIREYRVGAVIALTWHAVRPTDDEPVTFHDSVQGHLTDWEWQQLLTPGTDLYNRWCRQVDVIAGYLQELQNAGVPVLFRPYHEMNGNWFWWGGRPGPHGSAALYRQLYDRFVHLHHLNNLIWVWNVNSPSPNAGPINAYFPGASYADVLTMDIYQPFAQSYYDSILALATPLHKPIALAEVGAMPSLSTLAAQSHWAYFMMWAGMAETENTPEQLQTMFHAPNIVDRGDPRLRAPLPPPSEPPLPVNGAATSGAQNLLASLYAAHTNGPIAGKLEPADALSNGSTNSSGTESVSPGTGALGMTVFTLNTVTTSSLRHSLANLREAAQNHQILMIRWQPGRPTDDAATGGLTDFEWKELLKPGSDLNARWNAQVDAVANLLKALEREHVAVLWSPYPESNSHDFWWAGRSGREGSQALVRMLYARLNAAQVNNLVWNWEPAVPGFGTAGNLSLDESYPGPLYADTMTMDIKSLSGIRFPIDRLLAAFAGGKPIGVLIDTIQPNTTKAPSPGTWSWIIRPAEGNPVSIKP
jgi:mannan endo-1,4-beta-mannosidase